MSNLLFLDLDAIEILMLLMALAYPILVIICLINIIQSTFKDPVNKILWALLIIFAPFVGSVVYLIIGGNTKVAA